jgi:hypothetical protein
VVEEPRSKDWIKRLVYDIPGNSVCLHHAYTSLISHSINKEIKMSANIRIIAIVIIIYALLIAAPDRHVDAKGPRADTFYSFSESGPFGSMEILLTWEKAPQTGYIYPSFFFVFQQPAQPVSVPGGFRQAHGYMGIQLVGSKKQAIFSIWDVREDSGTAQKSPLTPWCKRFSGEGTGAQCIIAYPWAEGRAYKLKVRSFGVDDSGELWIGTIFDSVTALETTIGIIHAKTVGNYPGYGHLTGRSVTFLEYFGSANTCDNQPYAKVFWRGPFANSGSYTASRARSYRNECSSTNTGSAGRPGVVQEGGGGVKSSMPNGTVLWQSRQ